MVTLRLMPDASFACARPVYMMVRWINSLGRHVDAVDPDFEPFFCLYLTGISFLKSGSVLVKWHVTVNL